MFILFAIRIEVFLTIKLTHRFIALTSISTTLSTSKCDR